MATFVCGECRAVVCAECLIECRNENEDGVIESCFTTLCLSPGCADASWVTHCDGCTTLLPIPKCPCGDECPRFCSECVRDPA